jgi:tRNA(fMet)-specific endonuclease VapC
VLDSNVVSRVLDSDERALRRLAKVGPLEVGIPLLVVAELLFGAEKSGRRAQNMKRIESIINQFPVLPMELAIARRYAVVRADVERRGRSKSDFDLIIACTALEHGATLVTNDSALKDGAIEGLAVEDWLI